MLLLFASRLFGRHSRLDVPPNQVEIVSGKSAAERREEEAAKSEQ